MAIAYLGLGSNLGNRAQALQQAQQLLTEHKITLLTRSSLYETAPQLVTDQPPFLNQVVKIETTLSPQELLQAGISIEQKLGRQRDTQLRYGPRAIDIDILLYDDITLNAGDLIIPHPFMHERAFVMIPLLEIDPSFRSLFNEKCWASQLEGVRLYAVS